MEKKFDASCSPVPVLDQSVFGLSGETILVVEDDFDSRQAMAWRLKQLGCRVFEAAGGLEAWSLLQKEEIQIVVTDWTMPGLDGPGLCEYIRSTDFGRYVYVILVTARESKDDVVEGLQRGADDFLSKPFHPGELVARIRAGKRILAFDRTVREQRDTISKAYGHISRDLTSAAALQQSLLPRVTQPDSSLCDGLFGLQYDWLFFPSQRLAGDLLNVFRLDENHVGFFVLDVAGHGVPAAMLSMTLASTIVPSPLDRSPLKYPLATAPYYRLASPPEAVSDLNKRFQAGPDSLSYFTMSYGVLDCSTGRVRLTQAGHPRPIHWPRHGRPQPLGENGFPVGLLPDVDYAELTFVLERGERLVLYSDGLVDCCNPQGEAFGLARLMKVLSDVDGMPLHVVISQLKEDVRAWHGTDAFEDDLTCLVLERCEAPQSDARPAPDTDELRGANPSQGNRSVTSAVAGEDVST